MTKFLIFSIFFHAFLITIFNLKKTNSDIIENNIINVTYVENEVFEKKKPQKKNLSNKILENKAKKLGEQKKPSKKSQISNTEKKVIKPTNDKNKDKKTKKKISKNNTQNNFNDMLKDLAEKELVTNKKNVDDINKKIKNLSNEKISDKKISPNKENLITIANILLMQINNNWTRPPGIQSVEDLNIKIVITLDPSGNVTSINIPSDTDAMLKKEKFLFPYFDSAIRAIKKSSPFEGLEKYRYNIWKKININFKPFETN